MELHCRATLIACIPKQFHAYICPDFIPTLQDHKPHFLLALNSTEKLIVNVGAVTQLYVYSCHRSKCVYEKPFTSHKSVEEERGFVQGDHHCKNLGCYLTCSPLDATVGSMVTTRVSVQRIPRKC